MKISYNWLQKYIEEKLPEPEKLKEVIIFHAFEVESIDKVGNDTVFDIKVLPDRAHDCLGHRGVAKEIASLLKLTYKNYTSPEFPNTPLSTKIEIQSELCRRYIAIEISGIKVGPSPKWLIETLESLGMRSINNIVDVTNLILLDHGQPVHAYDADKIDGGIVVRMAHEGEQVVTLSKEEKKLGVSDLVIADYLGVLAIAGVKGGASAEITENTKRIVVEIGNFDSIAIRKTSRRLSLVTDASKRFENDLSPEVALPAALHALELLKEIAGGTVTGVLDIYPQKQIPTVIQFSLKDITRVLGAAITQEHIESFLSAYKYSYKSETSVYELTVPLARLDLRNTTDIAEEVGRFIGYEHIPATPFVFSGVPNTSEYQAIASVKRWLAKNGFREVMNYAFTKKGDLFVSYGPKDRSALRTNLSDGLKESYERNKLQAPLLGVDTIKLFEMGTVFLSKEEKIHEEIHVATVNNGTFEELALPVFMEKYAIGLEEIPSYVFSNIRFAPWSPYPFITRDIAIWTSSIEDQQKLEDIVSKFAKMYCVRPPVLFDRFEKEGKTSIAYRFVFQSFEKTLTEKEVEESFSMLIETIKKEKTLEIR